MRDLRILRTLIRVQLNGVITGSIRDNTALIQLKIVVVEKPARRGERIPRDKARIPCIRMEIAVFEVPIENRGHSGIGAVKYFRIVIRNRMQDDRWRLIRQVDPALRREGP